MTDKTLTRAKIAAEIHKKVGLSRSESMRMVESIIDHISEALERGENVKISGFGSFILRDKKQRIGRNPKTGEEAIISPRRVLTFRVSHAVRNKIAGLKKK